jgi:thiol-disulfide isomerase/thioredoxin
VAKRHLQYTLVLAGLVALAAVAPTHAQGQRTSPTVEQMLSLKPIQEGVDISTPAKSEYAQCEVKLETGSKPNSSGWVLLDPKKQPLRKFFDSTGAKHADGKTYPDVWSYYKDGVEVYREIDTNKNGKADQYRWLNAAGTKWGIDVNEDGKIDGWRMISAEEAAQEAYVAVVTRDFNRLRLLFISEEEIRSLRIPDAQASKIRDGLSKAQARFQELCSKATNLNSQAQFVRVESMVPQCVPAADAGPAQDLLKFSSRAILYQGADKKHEWLHTGEIVLVGQAWRLTDIPSVTDVGEVGTEQPRMVDEGLKKLLEDLERLDKSAPTQQQNIGSFPAVVDYNTKRVALLEQIYTKATDAKDKAIWMRQILDNLCTGQQANKGETKLLAKLVQYRDLLSKSAPGSELAAYAHYREMWARYAPELAEGNAKTQQNWNDELVKFVTLYPRAEDAADAMFQLGMTCEFGPKEKQEEARRYYSLLATNFPEHPLAGKARGAAKRLDLNGKTMQLAAPTLQGGSFDLAKLHNKVTIVYYWASDVKVSVGDFALMKQMQVAYGAKGLEIVAVNLDETPQAAQQFLAANPLPATHLFQASDQARGRESPLATQYGIIALPTIILVGKDGRVIDRSIQVNDLEDAIKKAL